MDFGRRQFLKLASTTALASAFAIDQNTAQAVSTADIQHGPRDRAQIALTFHGAGAPDFAEPLLKIFRSTETPVTIFAVGTWLLADSSIGKRIIDAGHDLGNHTMTHTQMKTISKKKVDAEIGRCAEELKKQIGNHGAFFRPSGTQYSTSIIRAAAVKYGYGQCISYEVDSHDFEDPSKTKVISNVLNNIQNGSIVSLHLGHKVTLEAMPGIIEGLHAKGLKPVTVSQLLAKA